MISKPKLAAVRSLHTLVRTPMWSAVDEFLRDEVEALANRLLDTTDATDIHELRGRIKFAKEFLLLCQQTQSLVEKLEKTEK